MSKHNFTLFQIPIYSYSKDVFSSKWNKRVEENKEGLIESGLSNEKAIKYSKGFSFPYRIWKFNQIVGYIEIIINCGTDIIFEMYISDKKRCFINSGKKCFIQKRSINGMRFRIEKDFSNESMGEKLLSFINRHKKYLSKNRYIDLENFKLVYKHIDYKKIIEKILNSHN